MKNSEKSDPMEFKNLPYNCIVWSAFFFFVMTFTARTYCWPSDMEIWSQLVTTYLPLSLLLLECGWLCRASDDIAEASRLAKLIEDIIILRYAIQRHNNYTHMHTRTQKHTHTNTCPKSIREQGNIWMRCRQAKISKGLRDMVEPESGVKVCYDISAAHSVKGRSSLSGRLRTSRRRKWISCVLSSYEPWIR